MKVVLCYGDSNTHGYVPGTGARYPFDIRWTGVLQKQLGFDVRVIEEGLCGRTTILIQPLSIPLFYKKAGIFPPFTHLPVKLVFLTH